MISLSQDDDAAIRRHVQRYGPSSPQARIPIDGKIATDCHVIGANYYFLIGPDGRIVSTEGNSCRNDSGVIESSGQWNAAVWIRFPETVTA